MKLVFKYFIAFFLVLSISACSFVEDRSADIVQVVDASEASKTGHKPAVRQKQQEKKSPKKYYVKRNDTLGTISYKTLGSAGRYRELASFNSLDYRQPLTVGQLILIPSNSNYIETTEVRPLKRPTAKLKTIGNEVSNFPELDSLIEKKQYNQAIDWALTHPKLGSSAKLQAKLVTASELQAKKEVANQNYSEALFLMDGLLNNKNISARNKSILQVKKRQIQVNDLSQKALAQAKNEKIDSAYQSLLSAYQLDPNRSKSLNDFITARELVAEPMHQKALKLYRNQQLSSAMKIWQDILAIKPNDDLALVYTDRVKNLQKKLNKIN